MTNLHECLLILNALKSKFALGMELIITKKENIRRSFEHDNWCQIDFLTIQLCCFFDELKIFERISKTNKKVKEILKNVAPGTRYIRQWTGLQSVRSKMVAHQYRDKKGRMQFKEDIFASVRAPTSYAEIFLCSKLSYEIIVTILNKFSDEFEDAINIYKSMKRGMVKTGVKNTIEMNTIFQKIKSEIQQNIKNF